MRVNLGCGDRYAEGGWLNVDHPGMPHRKDLPLDLRYPIPDEWLPAKLTHVYAGHLLEHLRVHECLSLLERLLPAMAPDGELMVVGPDVDLARGLEVAGTLTVTLESLICGAGRWSGDEHRWECSSRAIAKMLRITGWTRVTDIGIGNVPDLWPVADRKPVWQCAVKASPPGRMP